MGCCLDDSRLTVGWFTSLVSCRESQMCLMSLQTSIRESSTHKTFSWRKADPNYDPEDSAAG